MRLGIRLQYRRIMTPSMPLYKEHLYAPDYADDIQFPPAAPNIMHRI
jgi:hypothetical protein